MIICLANDVLLIQYRLSKSALTEIRIKGYDIFLRMFVLGELDDEPFCKHSNSETMLLEIVFFVWCFSI